MLFCSVNVYLTWRYAWLERTRTRLRNVGTTLKWSDKFSNSACVVLALASNFWLLLWVLGPSSKGGFNQVDKLTPATADDVPSW